MAGLATMDLVGAAYLGVLWHARHPDLHPAAQSRVAALDRADDPQDSAGANANANGSANANVHTNIPTNAPTSR